MGELLSGLIGALIGALVGFCGVVWQFNVQSGAKRRELAAELLAVSDEVHDTYENYFAGQAGTTFNPSKAQIDELGRRLRSVEKRWELAGSRWTYPYADRHARAARRLWFECLPYSHFSAQANPRNKRVDYTKEWRTSRILLVARLSSSKGLRCWQILGRIEIAISVRKPERVSARKIKKEIAKMMKSKSS